MNTFAMMILVCAAGMRPADCQLNSAVDVIAGPEAPNEIMCALHGQAYFAESALGVGLRQGEYVKVLCTRTSIGVALSAEPFLPFAVPARFQGPGSPPRAWAGWPGASSCPTAWLFWRRSRSS